MPNWDLGRFLAYAILLFSGTNLGLRPLSFRWLFLDWIHGLHRICKTISSLARHMFDTVHWAWRRFGVHRSGTPSLNVYMYIPLSRIKKS